MACRKAFDLDLVACLLDTGRPEWSEFREHYPRCAECAAEVRTWTELQSGLAPAHPGPEDLIRFESRANDLAPDARKAIAAHIATCRSCRDELRALRAFDPRAVSPGDERPAPRRGWWRGMGRLVLHPAFAYGVALMLAIPLLFPEVGRRVAREIAARRTELERRWDSPATVGETQSSHPTNAAGAPPPAYQTERDAAHDAPAAPAPDTRAAAKSASAPDARRQAPSSDDWPVVVLTPNREVVLHAPAQGLVVRLAPPRSQPALPPGLAWLRVRDAAGRRELREQQFGTPGSNAEIRIPAAWLEPGRYRADIILGEGARPVTVAHFRIES